MFNGSLKNQNIAHSIEDMHACCSYLSFELVCILSILYVIEWLGVFPSLPKYLEKDDLGMIHKYFSMMHTDNPKSQKNQMLKPAVQRSYVKYMKVSENWEKRSQH